MLFLNDGTFADEMGVLEFAVSGIPKELPVNGPAKYLFFPKHVPEDLNFAHSELWCDSVQVTGGYVRPGKIIRKELRAILSQHVSPKIEAKR